MNLQPTNVTPANSSPAKSRREKSQDRNAAFSVRSSNAGAVFLYSLGCCGSSGERIFMVSIIDANNSFVKEEKRARDV